MNVNWLTLHFADPEQEREFQGYYIRRFGGMMRIAIASGVLLYALFGFLDYQLYPQQVHAIWLWRYGMAMPVLLLVAYYLFRRDERAYSQPVIAIGSLVGGLGIVGMTTAIPPEAQDVYFAGLMLVAMFTYTVFRLQFVWAASVSWVVLVTYNVASLLSGSATPAELLTANFFYVSANLMGMVACYEMEYDARYNFVLQRELQAEQTRLDQLNRRLDELAHHDHLTRLANRRYFFEHFQQEWNRHLRHAAPLSLVIIDVDDFKAYNDTYGHQAGDDCLRQIAETLADTARRAGDFVARLGGEEFVALLARTDAEDACRLAEKLRWRVEQMAVPHSASRVADVVTISAGAATTIPAQEYRLEDLLRRADEALYEAKAAGRNRVICRNDAPPSPR